MSLKRGFPSAVFLLTRTDHLEPYRKPAKAGFLCFGVSNSQLTPLGLDVAFNIQSLRRFFFAPDALWPTDPLGIGSDPSKAHNALISQNDPLGIISRSAQTLDESIRITDPLGIGSDSTNAHDAPISQNDPLGIISRSTQTLDVSIRITDPLGIVSHAVIPRTQTTLFIARSRFMKAESSSEYLLRKEILSA